MARDARVTGLPQESVWVREKPEAQHGSLSGGAAVAAVIALNRSKSEHNYEWVIPGIQHLIDIQD
jgi:hypothetical protein